MADDEAKTLPSVVRTELALWVGIATALLFTVFGTSWLADLSNPLWYNLLFGWLFAVMLWLAWCGNTIPISCLWMSSCLASAALKQPSGS